MKKRTASLSRLLLLALALTMCLTMLAGCGEEPETAFTPESANFSNVYADIVSIEPMYQIGTGEDEATAVYTHAACVCDTADGGEIWVYISQEEYLELFDPTADFESYFWTADRQDFDTAIRIHGQVRKSESLCDGLSTDTGHETMLSFKSMDP